jgi:DHA1 family bicyclomycin/chloramphenicol resistance-like MFS transporter
MIIPDAPARADVDGAHPAAAVNAPPATPFDSNRIRASFVLLLGALTAIGPFTIDMYLAAFPQITADMGTQPAAVQLTITATLAGLALGQLLIGSISDALGRRAPLIGGMALYIAASLGIVFVQSVEMLTALRFVEGLAASAGMVLSMAIVRDRYHGVQVGKVLARLMLVVGVAPSIAPIIGAQLLLLGSWRIMFVALAGFGMILLLLAIFLLPESLPAQRRRSGGVGPALHSYGSLITDPTFMGLTLLSGFSMAALFTYVSSATFVFQEGYGLSAQQFALVFASGAVCITAGTQINGALIGRWTPERILTVAVFAGLAATGSMLTVALLGLGMWPLIAMLLLTLLVTGILLPAVPVIALEANAHRAGSAAALLGALQFGVGAAVAPITGLFREGSPVAMAAVMFAAVSVTVGLLLAVRPGLKRGVRTTTEPAGSEFSAAERTV